ncbi:MAG: SDR family oxidoreductase [bacterium]|nr:SDR family oxidoreductase [bacterium]
MLNGKVAIVTGGTRGIGFSIVKKFLENGAKVALLGSRKETVDQALQKLKQINNQYEVIGFCPVLHSENEVKECCSKVANTFGKIDILVNNAGISSRTRLEDYTEDEYDKIANLNIKSAFICSKVASSYLKDTKGVILNTSSMVSIYGQPSGVMYPVSKFAINGLTKSLARELAPFSVRVNAIAPGITETDMVKQLPKEVIEPLITTIPLGRIGTTDDVANAFLFLASDMATYITGEILQVDGGARS